MNKSWLDFDLILTHSLDMRQFIDFRQSTLPNGLRIIDAYNSSGLTFTLLPDRGMDIWSAHYNGMPLTWIAPGSPHPPDYGQSWLGQFNGGLLTTCGLTHVGPPEDGHDIHGHYTRQRATNISKNLDKRVIRLQSHIQQSTLFGEQIRLQRTYTLKFGRPEIHIYDEVQNIGDEPIPFMILYHCNLGYPLIREGTELLTASDVYARDQEAKAGLETWHLYEGASPQYAEQVFFHHSKMTKGERRDMATVALVNDDIGLAFSWNTRNMPYLTQWKNTRQGIYVCGIEPGNCIPEGQNAARESGRLVMLEAGECHYFDLLIKVLDSHDQIHTFQEKLRRIRSEEEATKNVKLTDYQRYAG